MVGLRRPGRAGAGPDPDAVASTARRLAGALVLAGIASGLAALVHRSWRDDVRPSRPRPPFSMADAGAYRPDGSVWRPASGGSEPVVVIYVVRGCPHCAAELRRWDELLSRDGVSPGYDVRVVAPRDLSGDPWLPASLRGRALRDSAGSIGRAVGAELVPTTAYATGGGTVVALTRGQTPARRIRRLVHGLGRRPDDLRR